MRGYGTYQAIALPAIHQSIHNIQDLQPQVEHAFPLGEQLEVVQECLAEQCRGLHARLAHADGVGGVDFWL